MNIDQVIERVRDINLDAGHYAIFGSGPLLVRGIIATVNDVDILARGPAWDTARTKGELVTLPEHGVTVASLDNRLVTIGTEWAIGDVDVDDALDSADIISGLPWVRLDLVAEYKRLAARPKDIEHLRLLQRWLDSGRA